MKNVKLVIFMMNLTLNAEDLKEVLQENKLNENANKQLDVVHLKSKLN